jgi:hypothetical protein
MDTLLHLLLFSAGLAIALGTFFSAISTFVLPRSVRSQLNRLVFGLLRRIIEIPMRHLPGFEQQDFIMGYYAPIGLMLLVPTWYLLVAFGYGLIYISLGIEPWQRAFVLSGSSLLTLGIFSSEVFLVDLVIFSEATMGLILVALLIAYLPTMYAAFSKREVAVNLLEVRAGNPASAVEMILRYHRIHGLERLEEYWFDWETWFAEVEESHTVLPALVFFRSPRPQNSWIVAAGTVLDAASLVLSAIDIPRTASAQLCIRAGFMCLRRICDYFDITYSPDPHYPQDTLSLSRAEFETALDRLAAAGVAIVSNRDQAWQDFAGWRVNYDRVLLALCSLVMAPSAPWTSDRAPQPKLPPLFVPKPKKSRP